MIINVYFDSNQMLYIHIQVYHHPTSPLSLSYFFRCSRVVESMIAATSRLAATLRVKLAVCGILLWN